MKGRTGLPIKSQEIYYYADGRTAFISYNSKVVEIDSDGQVTLFNPFWDMYSQTTNRYLLRFLDNVQYPTNSIKDVRKLVNNGTYLIV
tara:strand:+ start:2134 stop:2397 length:264 start_codon:yes stop_codon:yes gene_type:complete